MTAKQPDDHAELVEQIVDDFPPLNDARKRELFGLLYGTKAAPQDTWHRGHFMQTYTGRQFYPLDPRAEDIDILDIAHSLSMQCRYNGHVQAFMSVAEHCVLMSGLVSKENALWALLHDATEAYVGDMIRPLKLHMPEYRAIEDKIMLAIAKRFGIADQMPEEVHEADSRILLDERAALLGEPAGDWGLSGLEPFDVEIQAWSPIEAEAKYMTRYLELTS